MLKELFNQPAKLADRVIAPGEASEPGVTMATSYRACEAGDRWLVTGTCRVMMVSRGTSVCRPFGALSFLVIGSPGSEASPGAITLSASFAGSLNNYFHGCGLGRAV